MFASDRQAPSRNHFRLLATNESTGIAKLTVANFLHVHARFGSKADGATNIEQRLSEEQGPSPRKHLAER